MKNVMLIIDHSESNRATLNKIFKKQFDIIETETAEEGLQFLQEHEDTVSIVLLDLILPGMSGLDFIKEKKKIENICNIPVMIITESESIDDQVACLKLGVHEFVRKPIIPEVVKASVNNVLFHEHQMKIVQQEIKNLKLKSETDEMTGLANKANTELTIDSILKNNTGTLDVLIVFDIDHFKTVNDTLGHQVGDKVIKVIANIIAALVRQSDVAGRIGGDEFCVLLRNISNMDVVYAKLREICQLMKYKPSLPIPDYVTLSIGFVSNERKPSTYRNLFTKADEALFQVKQNGKGHFREYGVEYAPVPKKEETEAEKDFTTKKKDKLILIVDDDSIIRRMFKDILDKEYDILEAENGVEAMQLINEYENRLVAVILDLYMPNMNGYQVLETMKRSNTIKAIPVIVSTSDTSSESDLRILHLGANLIIHKPVQADIVVKQIDNLVDAYLERKKETKHYTLQKTLIGNQSNTFLCTYYFETNKAEIGESYLKYVSSDFPDIFATYPFQIEKIVLTTDCERARKFFNEQNGSKQREDIEIRLKVENSQYEWFNVSKVFTYDEEDHVESVIFMFLNIEYEIEAKQSLAFLSSHDSLTRIPNIATFTNDVKNLLQNNQEEFAILSMDFFQFRIVNKIFGHKVGDDIIKYVATRIQEEVEEIGLGAYCRASADVFYICLSQQENIAKFMQMLQQSMSKYPIKYQIKLCFGIFNIENRDELVENMIEHSSFARKAAKEAPVKTFQYYNSDLEKKETFETVATVEMEEGLKTRQFEIYLQPKCDIETYSIVGAEALIRWNHPKEGYLSPAYFIPVFEQNGTCVELDYFVYEQVCKTLRTWLDEGKTVVPISVNVSRWSLYNEDLEKNICDLVDKYQIPHEYIEFEITESAFVLETDLLSSFSENMRKKGFHILIDDFGSGYSSLNSLKDISVDVLKIDIKFLPIAREEKAEIVLSAVINMGKNLGLDIIAEGVETKVQLEMLKSLGCKSVQGYYFYKPMPCNEFKEILRITRANEATANKIFEGKRILMCEDVQLNAKIARRLLENKKMIVEQAENGQLGVKMIEESEEGYYDAILMDIRMPVMDGLQAARAIRNLNRKDTKKIPIIAMTAYDYEMSNMETKEAGMNAHLIKPVEPEKMYNTLKNLLKNS